MPLFTEPFTLPKRFSRLEPRCGGVYALEHTPSGLTYIGQTSRFNKRWGQHRTDLKRGVHPCTPLQGLFFESEPSAFRFVALGIIPSDVVNAEHQRLLLERRWFWVYRSQGRALNREIMPPEERCLYPLLERAPLYTAVRQALHSNETRQIGLELSDTPSVAATRHRSATSADVKNLTEEVIL